MFDYLNRVNATKKKPVQVVVTKEPEVIQKVIAEAESDLKIKQAEAERTASLERFKAIFDKMESNFFKFKN